MTYLHNYYTYIIMIPDLIEIWKLQFYYLLLLLHCFISKFLNERATNTESDCFVALVKHNWFKVFGSNDEYPIKRRKEATGMNSITLQQQYNCSYPSTLSPPHPKHTVTCELSGFQKISTHFCGTCVHRTCSIP